MQTISNHTASVNPDHREARVCRWIVTIDGQRARVPATFRQFLGLVPAILGGNPKREAV